MQITLGESDHKNSKLPLSIHMAIKVEKRFLNFVTVVTNIQISVECQQIGMR